MKCVHWAMPVSLLCIEEIRRRNDDFSLRKLSLSPKAIHILRSYFFFFSCSIFRYRMRFKMRTKNDSNARKTLVPFEWFAYHSLCASAHKLQKLIKLVFKHLNYWQNKRGQKKKNYIHNVIHFIYELRGKAKVKIWENMKNGSSREKKLIIWLILLYVRKLHAVIAVIVQLNRTT